MQAASIVDTTWLHNDSNWLVEKSLLGSLDVGNLDGINSTFAKLCILEQETSLLNGVPETLTSAASQIASTVSGFEQPPPLNRHYDSIMSVARLLDDYCELATKQHVMLQKATEHTEVEWRLGVLDAASKYVDRQVEWSLGFAEVLSRENIDGVVEETDTEPTVVNLIPMHIGYTRRTDVQETPSEGLEASSLVAITEKGKKIVENIILINQLRLDNGYNRTFNWTEAVVTGTHNIANLLCISDEHLGKIIDGLYFIFYENINHIKLLIGDGDEGIGDRLIRTEAVYECIFNVKTIRNDLRHDLDHGSEKERRKKLKNAGDCYKKYCNCRPMKGKDYRRLQEKLYDEMIALENSLMQFLRV